MEELTVKMSSSVNCSSMDLLVDSLIKQVSISKRYQTEYNVTVTMYLEFSDEWLSKMSLFKEEYSKFFWSIFAPFAHTLVCWASFVCCLLVSDVFCRSILVWDGVHSELSFLISAAAVICCLSFLVSGVCGCLQGYEDEH